MKRKISFGRPIWWPSSKMAAILDLQMAKFNQKSLENRHTESSFLYHNMQIFFYLLHYTGGLSNSLWIWISVVLTYWAICSAKLACREKWKLQWEQECPRPGSVSSRFCIKHKNSWFVLERASWKWSVTVLHFSLCKIILDIATVPLN